MMHTIISIVRHLCTIFPAAALALTLSASALAFDLHDTRFTDTAHGVTLHAPYGWKLHRTSGYPSILVVLVSPDGSSTISLTAGHLRPGQGLPAYLSTNCSAARKVGLRVQECGPAQVAGRRLMKVLARAPEQRSEVHQLYITGVGRVFILTLSCPARRSRDMLSKLIQVLDTIKIQLDNSSRAQGDTVRGSSGQPRDTATRGRRAGKQRPGKGQQAPLPELGAEPLPELGSEGASPGKPGPGKGLPPQLEGEPLPELGTAPAPGSQPASRPSDSK